jgi:two-component system, LuxR family, sensor kinase FixL
LQLLFELSTDAEFLVDDALRIRLCNPEATREFGADGEDLNGHPFLELLPSGDRSVVEHAFALGADHTDRKSHVAVRGQRKDGSSFPADVFLGELHQGGRHWFAVVVHHKAAGESDAPVEPEIPAEGLDLRAILFAQRLKELT